MKRIRSDCNDGDSHLADHFGIENLQDVAYCMWWILQHVGIVAERVA